MSATTWRASHRLRRVRRDAEGASPATFLTVSQVRVVTSLPKVFSINGVSPETRERSVAADRSLAYD
jgi:hypothetical protein